MPHIPDLVHTIAARVSDHGGRAYYVGGCVRDEVMNLPSKDIDIEIHGVTEEALSGILKEVGEPLRYGQSFGVFALKGAALDIALPRDAEGRVDPFIGPTAAARRRDFTMNALMKDALTGEILDPFGGRGDIAAGIIRHVDDATFIRDPLRVLRGAQFSARFGFDIAPATEALCRELPLDAVARERVFDEVRKALLKGRRPSRFFEALRRIAQLSVWFPELQACIGVEQDPVYHPEGDVWTHTMQVIDRAAAYRDRVSDPAAFMLLALTHDLGKVITTAWVNGRIHAYEHETKGLPLIERFLRRLTDDQGIIRYVLGMAPLHMRPNMAAFTGASVKATNRLFDLAPAPEDLIYFALSDRPADRDEAGMGAAADFLFERLNVFNETMARPFVQGRDLVGAGIEPGPQFAFLLDYAHKLRLAGVDRELALKQVIGMAGKGDHNA